MKLRMTAVALALVGALMCTYLTLWKLGFLGALVCGTGGCETVQLSKWGSLFGIPVALYGVVGYLAILVVGMAGIQPGREDDARPAMIMFLLAAGGVAFTLYLTYLEAFVIHAWCRWCLASAAIITAVFVLSGLDWHRSRKAAS